MPALKEPRGRRTVVLLCTLFLSTGLIGCAGSEPLNPTSGASLDPDVQAAVADISAQRIERYDRGLVRFGTRHTLSDAVSETRGIGAASRWIEGELKACAVQSGGRLQVTMDRHVVPAGPRVPSATPLVNVVATLPGVDPQAAKRILVVSGHYDSRVSDIMNSTADAPGANDDASGVAAMMEMACVMASHRYEATLVFMAVAGEEQGLLGAEQWAENAKRQGLRVEAMITNDIIGSPVGDAGQRDAHQVRLFADGLAPLLQTALRPRRAGQTAEDDASVEALRAEILAQVRTGGSADFATNQLGRQLKEIGERYVPGFTVNLIQRPDRYLRGGDHMAFLSRGFAAVRFTEPFENFAHQHQDLRVQGGTQFGDLPEFVDFPYVADVARINLAGLATLAHAPGAPQHASIETVELVNDSTLHWDPSPDANVAGYRVLWRETGSPAWQGHRDVGVVTRVTVPISKDNVIFGVEALDRRGNASLAAFPLPAARP